MYVYWISIHRISNHKVRNKNETLWFFFIKKIHFLLLEHGFALVRMDGQQQSVIVVKADTYTQWFGKKQNNNFPITQNSSKYLFNFRMDWCIDGIDWKVSRGRYDRAQESDRSCSVNNGAVSIDIERHTATTCDIELSTNTLLNNAIIASCLFVIDIIWH